MRLKLNYATNAISQDYSPWEVRGSSVVAAADKIEVRLCCLPLSASAAASTRSESTINWKVYGSTSQVYEPATRQSIGYGIEVSECEKQAL